MSRWIAGPTSPLRSVAGGSTAHRWLATRPSSTRWLATRSSPTRWIAAGRVGRLVFLASLDADIQPERAESGGEPTFSRASAQYARSLDYGQVTRLTAMSSGGPAIETIRDARTDRDDPGVHSNSLPWSEDLTHGWTQAQCTIGTGTGEALLNGTELQAIVADSSSGAHAVATSLTPTSDWIHILSAKVRAGGKPACRLDSTDIFIHDVHQAFDLVGGTLGHATDGVIASAIYSMTQAAELGLVPDDWASDELSWLIWMAYYGGAFAHTHLLVPMTDADDPDSVEYTGDGATEDIYASELQHDYMASSTPAAEVMPRPYVRTSGLPRTLGRRVTGYLSEGERTGLFPDDFHEPEWTIRGGATVDRDVATAPDGSLTADRVTVMAEPDDAFVLIGAIGSGYYPSFWIRKISATGTLRVRHPYTGGTAWSVDLSLLDGGWNRIDKSHPAVTFVADFGSNPLDGIYFSALSGTIEAYFWAVNATVSPILTSTIAGQAIREATRLTYPGGRNAVDGPGPRTYVCRCVCHAGHSGVLVDISDGTDSNRVYVTIEPTTGVARVRTAIAVGDAGDVTGTTNIADGEEHEVRVLLSAGSLRLIVDGAEEGVEDTSADVPQGLSQMDVGADYAAANHINGVITDLRCYRGLRSA